jgi:hypothetical protein
MDPGGQSLSAVGIVVFEIGYSGLDFSTLAAREETTTWPELQA